MKTRQSLLVPDSFLRLDVSSRVRVVLLNQPIVTGDHTSITSGVNLFIYNTSTYVKYKKNKKNIEFEEINKFKKKKIFNHKNIISCSDKIFFLKPE